MAVQAIMVHLVWGRSMRASPESRTLVMGMNAPGMISDWVLLRRSATVMAAVLVAFVFARPLRLEPATIALTGAAVLMLIDNWRLRDGKQADNVQLNCLVYKGAPTTPPVTTSVSPTQDPQMAPLGFDAEADFHVYAMEWTPSSVRFTADGALLRSWSSEVSRMKLPQNILLTIWASNAPSWAGAVGSDSAPTTADVDWIKVYSFNQGG